MQNCPVEYSDVINAWNIYSEDVGGIRGKTTRIKPKVVDTDGIIKIPQELLYNLQDITLCADVMFVNKLVVCTRYSRKVRFTTVEVIKNQSMDKLYAALKKVLTIYAHREVLVNRLLTDRQFLPLEDALLQNDDAKLNVTSANKQVGDVERNIRVLKERIQAIVLVLPFEVMPKAMKVACLKLTAFWMNMFPCKGGISKYYGPRAILLSDIPDYVKICQVPFGAYCEVSDEPLPTNTLQPRTASTIALCPECNIQGKYYFLSIDTWKILSQRQWRELPLTEAIINKVNLKGREDLGLSLDDPILDQFVFTYLDGTLIPTTDIPIVTDQGGNATTPQTTKTDNSVEIEEGTQSQEGNNTEEGVSPDKNNSSDTQQHNNNSGEDEDKDIKSDHIEKDNEVPETKTRYNLRHTPRSYSYRFGMNIIHQEVVKRIVKPLDGFGAKYRYMVNVILAQMSARKGLKVF